MTTIVLGVGDFAVTAEPVEYVCYGLGSCVALFLYDEPGSITAGAHIPVPRARKGSPLTGADSILDEMVTQLANAGYKAESFKAKITGGARINKGSMMTVGDQNIHAIHRLLQAHRISITSSDVGGHTPRTARFRSTTGTITISTPDKRNYQI